MCQALLLLIFAMHPVHETVTEVEWNDESKRFEVAIRMDNDDERWIKKSVQGDGEVSSWAIAYLQRRFRVADPPKSGRPDPSKYHWIGRDRDGAHVWWYFEIEPADGRPVVWVDQQLLFEREPNYTHRVLVLNHQPPRALNITAVRTKVRLDESTAQAAESESDSADASPSPTSPDHDDAPLPPTDL
ncbi:hypothetical protein Poly51_08400 [Rubripirellula tenax]|uniref:Uncharacterized protein n=1 Tax=Rubripirellula tenax TaxID=2528015 RepID=A0A5C6FJ05_9BACT|nr:DUF6702 family protein [Rubripirellula tenax]TWU60563.1 hypothetical protein Poly51_08400 [Rubripirellula tenax]